MRVALASQRLNQKWKEPRGGPYLAEGEAAVIEPRGQDGFRVVARIRKDEWMRLAPP